MCFKCWWKGIGLAAMLPFSDFANKITRLVGEYPRTCALSTLIMDYKVKEWDSSVYFVFVRLQNCNLCFKDRNFHQCVNTSVL